MKNKKSKFFYLITIDNEWNKSDKTPVINYHLFGSHAPRKVMKMISMFAFYQKRMSFHCELMYYFYLLQGLN